MPKKYVVISSSLREGSLSRVLAKQAFDILQESKEEVTFLDLSDFEIPSCDGGSCFSHPVTQSLKEALLNVDGYLVSVPVYNYSVSSTFKNLIEITGRDVWTDKVVGFLAVAGGQGSYMSLANIMSSLMLDFRTFILPRFVYSTGEDFEGMAIKNVDVESRLNDICREMIRVTSALTP